MNTVLKLALAGVLSVAAMSPAFAQSVYSSPENCVAEVGKLDTNGDGYVDNTEASQYGRIETNVDTNGDGRLSADERTVACKSGLMDAFKPSGERK